MAYGDSFHIEQAVSDKPNDMVLLHAHQNHELYYLVSGQRRYFIGHTIFDVYPGNLVIIPRTELHRTTSPGTKGYDRYVIYFSDKEMGDLIDAVGAEAYGKFLQVTCLQLPPAIAQQVKQEMEALMQERMLKRAYADAFAVQHLRNILLAALRHGTPREPCTGETADKIQEVARYISQNYSRELTLSEAAAMAYMEETYFSKQFKKLTGFGFREYLTQTRIRAAEQLLQTTALSVSAIAEQCGFSGGNYFGDAFRRCTGLSPRQYRENYR